MSLGGRSRRCGFEMQFKFIATIEKRAIEFQTAIKLVTLLASSLTSLRYKRAERIKSNFFEKKWNCLEKARSE